MKVIKKPIRVLLLAAAANRDYQFVRTMLVREVEKKRIELAIHLQLPPGQDKYREGVVQDVPPNRLLTRFPDSFRKIKGDLYDLSSYDVIIGFDPDWKRLSGEQAKMLKDWCEKGGGLVLVGGYINTVELIRPREGEDADRFKPILDLLPVVLDDRRDFIDRKTDDPWALDFENASPEMEFLKLDEDLDDTKFKEDWQAYFYGTGKERTDKPQRGFYSFYPVQRAKTGSIVVARYTDPAARLKDNTHAPLPRGQPRRPAAGRSGSARPRPGGCASTARRTTSGSGPRWSATPGPRARGRSPSRSAWKSPTVVSSNRYMEVEAKIEGGDGSPLDRKVRPMITLQLPPGVPETDDQAADPDDAPARREGRLVRGQVSGQVAGRLRDDRDRAAPAGPGVGHSRDGQVHGHRESNPELDNTRPDYDRMYRMASEADEVLLTACPRATATS